MKRNYLFTIFAAVAVLLACSKTNNPLDDALMDNQTRSENSGGGGGMGVLATLSLCFVY